MEIQKCEKPSVAIVAPPHWGILLVGNHLGGRLDEGGGEDDEED